MILTPEIREEWNRHQSQFARTWRVSMMARKKVVLTTTPRDAALRAQVIRHAADEPSRAAMLKDCCLVEGALAADGAVISLDERVRTLFGTISPQVRQIAPIIWVNPTLAGEEVEAWLAAGAKPEARRRLDHGA